MNCPLSFKLFWKLRMQSVLCTVLCLGLFACEPGAQTKISDQLTSEKKASDQKIFLEFAFDGVKEIPAGSNSVKDTLGLTFKVSTKDPEGNGPGGTAYSRVDSVHMDLRMTTIDPYKFASAVNFPAMGTPGCNSGSLSMVPGQFKPDSVAVDFPTDLLIHDVDCGGAVAEIGGGLIVIVEESLPDGNVSFQMANVTAWKNGKAVPVDY